MIRSLLLCIVFAVSLAGCTQSTTSLNPGNPPLFLPDSVRSWIDTEAAIVGFYGALRQDTCYKDTVNIPQWATSRVFNALGRIWQLKNSARDSVFDIFAIRDYSELDFHTVVPCIDTTLAVQRILKSYQFSKNPKFIREYTSPLFLNTIAIARTLDSAIGVDDSFYICSYASERGGDGNHLTARFNADTVFVDFSLGWNDCLSGCLSRRVWSFSVTESGSVKFLGASGDPPPQ